MPLDICFEAAGGIVHALDAVWSDRRFGGRRTAGSPSVGGVVRGAPIPALPDDLVRNAAAGLPIEDARSVWLVDVCGLSYGETACELGVSDGEVARSIRRARTRIRNQLAV